MSKDVQISKTSLLSVDIVPGAALAIRQAMS